MSKEAATKADVYELIKTRWSPRAFSEQLVGEEELETLFEAARWAASSYNEQPWRFIYAYKGDDHYDKLFDALVEFNQNWVKTAPVLAVVVSKKQFSHNGKQNRHYMYDAGQAVANLAIQATGQGLYIHQMAGFSPDKVKENLELPDEYEAVTMFTIGHVGEPERIPEDMQKGERAERSRKPLSEIVFRGKLK